MTAVRKISVLVAEDNPVNQEVVIAMLEDCGIKTRLAKNGEEAVAAMDSDSFDLILMDCQMPVLDGFEATSIIRNDEKSYCNIPIIAMTANSVMQSRNECLAAGMNDFLSKPVRKRDLEWILSKWAAYRATPPANPEEHVRGSYPPDSPAACGDSVPHLDLAALDRLRGVLKGKFSLMLDTFISSAERSLQHIQEALPENDMALIGRSAHSMKSSGQIGAVHLHHLAELTEHAAKRGEREILPELVENLSAELAIVKQALKDLPA